MKNKILVSFLAIVLFLTIIIFIGGCTVNSKGLEENNTKEFEYIDVNNDSWFKDDVSFVSEKGIMSGTGSEKFSPDITTSRGMMVTVLYRLDGNPEILTKCTFNDVKPGTYYEKAVIWASQNNIVTGYNKNAFGPDDSITREQLATILFRFAKYKNYDTTLKSKNEIYKFADAKDISDFAYESMIWANENGLVKGENNNKINPKGKATRAQIAAVIHRFCENIIENKSENNNENNDKNNDKVISNTPTFFVDSQNASSGSVVKVNISVKNNPGISSIGMFVTFGEELKLIAVDYNDKIGGQFMNSEDLSSPTKLIWISPFKDVENDWVFATLSFKVNKSVQAGYYPICISYELDDVYDMTEENIKFDVVNGAISVK